MDYSDENPIKVTRLLKLKKRIKKMRKKERRLEKAARLKKLAEGCMVNDITSELVLEKCV